MELFFAEGMGVEKLKLNEELLAFLPLSYQGATRWERQQRAIKKFQGHKV